MALFYNDEWTEEQNMLIPTRIHGILDYAVSLWVIAIPWVFSVAAGDEEVWVPVLLGSSSIMYSLITNYEWSIFRLIPMPLHLLLDGMSGIILAASPWVFRFNDVVYWPYLITGIAEILVVLFSSKVAVNIKQQRHT